MEPTAERGLSSRGWANVEAIMPRIKGAVEERKLTKSTNIDLATAENWLIRPQLIKICKESIEARLEPQHFSYPRGFAGEPALLDAYADFFNTYFAPHKRVEPLHLATAPGASGCIDAVLYNVCEAGDGILLPGPYWNGFDFGIRSRSGVTPVLVDMPTLDSNFDDSLVPALEKAYASASCPIKGLMMTNPHNPLGICYSKAILEQCVKFCARHGLHFISDEVYAMSVFPSPDLLEATLFVSVLSLDLDKLGVDRSRVHMIWSTSKDLGQSGIRMGCTVTQYSEEMVVGLALAAMSQTSALSTIFVTALLTSPELPALLALNTRLLLKAYVLLTSWFKRHGIEYIPANAGLYVFAKLVPGAETWEDEQAAVARFKDAGVLVSGGRNYHGPDDLKGWMRVGFAVPESQLVEAIRRMELVIAGSQMSAMTPIPTPMSVVSAVETADDDLTAKQVEIW